MLLSGKKKMLLDNYETAAARGRGGDERRRGWAFDRPAIVTKRDKSDRMAHPYIGIIPRSNAYSAVLDSYCKSLNPVYGDGVAPALGNGREVVASPAGVCEELAVAARRLCADHPFSDPEALVEFASAVMTQRTSRGCPVFRELRGFVVNLASFLNRGYSVKSDTIEPFQKQLILHTFYFLISIKAPQAANTLFDVFKEYFGLQDMGRDMLQTFKQKSTVYLIPRRHGKTWIVVAIIAMLLTSVENVHVGYVAHQKHVANSVFTEIVNTIYRWFPAKNVYVKKENGVVIYTGGDGRRPSTLMCATCFNKNSIRGQTFNLLYVDEANFIKKDSLPSILGFMLQKDAKIIFISSVNSSDQTTSFLYNLKNAKEKMLNVVNYVCPQHREDFSLQESVVSCPCYRLHIPTYITIDENIKDTTNLFMEGAFTTELMGDGAVPTRTNMHKVVSEPALEQFDLCRTDTGSEEARDGLEHTLYVYVDPAYTNNSEASGTGVGAVVSLRNKERSVVVGAEHFFLRELTGASALQIANCAIALIRSLAVLHPFLREAHVAIEGNSSQDSAVAIATFMSDCCPLPLKFLHHTDKASGVQWPMYMLGAEKAQAFESFIYALNSGTVSCSQTMVSNTIKLSFDPVAYLIEQIRAIKCYPLKDGSVTFCAKQKGSSDDTLVAVVMAHYFATSGKHVFKNHMKQI
nr:DNA packaging terminase subunit 1 [Equid gammaherpesvirus 5]UTK45452.1 DNA packaging terminase subunit 1 [Equid gammaherpesvirus 5]UTK45531.1 DNA packaging terminase subunit 1 [Equid gammaherpesvirus 5]UTK45610.1 DNA packaging terminase subunit 1 [Equid gammaherpesvirus 5]UTK45689.1 DNA packaging terminase subunit 1 [Equid gammaherpesvirus 5]